VRSALTGMGAASADGAREETATLHLVIDTPLPDASLPIPNDEQHRHFGVEQTEMSVELEPGLHTLQLVVGDASHLPHQPPIASEEVSIIVTNLEVKNFGGKNWIHYELASDLTIRWKIESEPFEEDLEKRRARLEERAKMKRLLEILAEDIRRAKRRRAAKQQRTLTLEVEDPPRP